MKVRVTGDAASDLTSIKAHLSEQSAIIAERVLDQIANVVAGCAAGACARAGWQELLHTLAAKVCSVALTPDASGGVIEV